MINLPPYPNNADPAWKGLSLQQMQMQRAMTQARMEIEKYKISAHADAVRGRLPMAGSGSLFSRVASVISLAEYGIFAIKIFRLLGPIFRRRR